MSYPVRRFIEEVWTNGRLDLIEELVSESYEVDGQPFGRHSVQENVLHFRRAFPNLVLCVDQFLDSESQCATLVRISGTHLGTWKGYPPSGNSVTYHEAGFWNLKNGRIQSGHFLVDRQAIRDQINTDNVPNQERR